ncbi:MAG TPA: tRNA (N(6)-L-threonylcarbamoyladenosine(37)-C(2))-methylthiotransferase MtaB [Planctomycetaceae bacterium]|nr:tRNA (N(6)-L-threonylcarbamoyladenosine(37)-C(2))-methylthiotransferase MtaB [Planctomycetaceae bacterium]
MCEKICQFVTLGCRVNQYETQLVKEALFRSGYREARDGERADLCIVNTCTVTATGDAKSRQLIRQLARKNPGARTIVMGCYATRDPESIAGLPGVWKVVTDKRELPDVLDRLGVGTMPSGISQFDGRQRATVKVQDGCILKCTYCIIPQVRPHLRSRPPEEIEEEVRRLVDNGYKEIVLSGIHIGHYGIDLRDGSRRPPRLWDLIRRLDRIPGQWRMRLSSIEATELTDAFVETVGECEHLCPHLHPALQSGSDAVLRRMRRRYRVRHFLKRIDRLRERLGRVALTTDVLVGFPGENEADFRATLRVCREVGFLKIHVFPFSPRRGTPAADFPDQVPAEAKKGRVHRLSELERKLAQQFYESLVGKRVEVLVERAATDRPGWVRGTDRHYVPVELPGTPDDVGRFVAAVGKQATTDSLLAERQGG